MLKRILSVIFLITLCCCEIDTSVSIDGSFPPKFQIDGSGRLMVFIVYEEPDNYKSVEDLKVLWHIKPVGKMTDVGVGQLPKIEYGKTPPEFLQVIPEEGNPPTLVEGKQYSAMAMTYGANGGAIDFFIKDGKSFIVEIEK